ncbi:MAG: ABC transporter substrate-binding protein [Alphaproteobacteria bacterium]|nr:ABC transporter substrate-binding protein [Alphaproteobacteria bacterium]
MLKRLAGVGVALLLGTTVAVAQSVTMAMSSSPTSVDPHYHTFAPNETLGIHMYDRLIERDPLNNLIPGLALSWKLIDDSTWELKLRQGVKFHDGSAFTAADVAYTFARVPTVVNSPGSFSIYTKTVVAMETPDPYTVRMKTNGIYPLLPVDLTNVFIIPKNLGPNPATEEFNSGRNAAGTGAFRMVSYKQGERVELERNDAWWGSKPHWQHLTIRMIPNDGARTAALLAGDVQLIEFVPTADATRLRADKRVTLAEIASQRIVYLWLDRSRGGPTPFITGPNGEALTVNPLNDKRVRQALTIAINRPAIVERVMEGAAYAAGQFVAPGTWGHAPGLNPPTSDVARAKALLAEAGYPNGLRITLHGPNDRYVNDGKIIQAIGQMWSRIGVQTTVDAITWPNYIARANKQDFSAYLLAWGFGEATNPLRALVYTFSPAKGWGAVNRGRYSNPEFDGLVDRLMVTADEAQREKLVIEATRIAMEDVALIPLHLQQNIWAMRAGLAFVPRADEDTRVMDLRPAP